MYHTLPNRPCEPRWEGLLRSSLERTYEVDEMYMDLWLMQESSYSVGFYELDHDSSVAIAIESQYLNALIFNK